MIKKFMGALLALCMLTSGFAGAVAQEANTSLAHGVGTPVVWTDEEQNPVATLTVTDLDTNFMDYDDAVLPDFGYKYQAVSITLENLSEDAIIIEPSRIGLVDNHGRTHSRSLMRNASAEFEVLRSAIAMAPGETVDARLAFETPAHASAALLTWNPGQYQEMIVNLIADAPEKSAIVFGTSTPAMFTDDFGNDVSSFQVTDVAYGWSDYSEYDEPDEGVTYVAVHISVNNHADRPMVFEPYGFNLIDSDGEEVRTSYARADEDAPTQPLRDPIDVQPGESAEAMLVFEIAEDSEAVAVTWGPSWSVTTMIFLEEAPEVDAGMATPEVVASPEAD